VVTGARRLTPAFSGGRERPHQQPFETYFAASAATPCSASPPTLSLALRPCHARLFAAIASLAGFAFPSLPPPLPTSPVRHALALPSPSPSSLRSPRPHSFAGLRWPPWQDRGLIGAHALDGRETFRDGAQPGQGDCRLFADVWLAVSFGDRRRVELRTEQVRGANRFALQRLRERRPTPAFSGAVSGIASHHENCAARPPLQRIVMRRIKAPRIKVVKSSA
jgi:hypothetical protein